VATIDNIARKVQALINQADHPNTDPVEAATFRAKAEALMVQYRIEEGMLAAKGDTSGLAPKWATWDLCLVGSEFAHSYRQMAYTVVHHVGAQGATKTERKDDGTLWTVIEVCGYEGDLRFGEMLMTAARLAFSQRLEPKALPELTDQENAYWMRMAGMEGRRIALALYGRDDKHLRPKVRNMFKAEALKRGEDPTPLLGKGVNVKGYREGYAYGFTDEIRYRLTRARAAQGEVAGGLVLAGKAEAVKEAFYDRYPQFRPVPRPAVTDGGEHQGTCKKCAAAKSGYCRDHAWMRPRKGDVRTVDGRGYRAGQGAAQSVDLGTAGRGRLS
jgi:hypothetical protein